MCWSDPIPSTPPQDVWKCTHTLVQCAVCAICRIDENTIANDGGFDGSIRIWQKQKDVHNKDIWKWAHTLNGAHRSSVFAICCMDENTIASGGNDSTLKIWQKQKDVHNEDIWRCTCRLDASDSIVHVICSIDENTIANSGGFDGSIRIWQKQKDVHNKDIWKCTHTLLKTHEWFVHVICRIDENTIASGGSGQNDRTMKIWQKQKDVHNKDIWKSAQTLPGAHVSNVSAICCVDENTIASVGENDSTLKIWQKQKNVHSSHIWKLSYSLSTHAPSLFDLFGARPSLFAVCCMDENTIASGGAHDATLNIWQKQKDVHNKDIWKCAQTLPSSHPATVTRLCRIDENTFASSGGSALTIWQKSSDIAKKKEIDRS